MSSIYWKDIHSFFSSLTAYFVIAVFLSFLGLFMWVFTDTSILEYNYASLDQLFSMAPLIFIFLIPAITMRSLSEEIQSGTMELLSTKPISDLSIISAKFLANFTLVIFALLPTLLYYYSVHALGSPKGNLDSGAILGSYIGLCLLGAGFVAIGMFASAITKNQVVAFVLGAFLCFFCYWAFHFLSSLPVFFGKVDDIIQNLGIYQHYLSISRGVLDSRDILYFLSLTGLFLFFTWYSIKNSKA
jgi:ABC-2 type transport system permease protein